MANIDQKVEGIVNDFLEEKENPNAIKRREMKRLYHTVQKSCNGDNHFSLNAATIATRAAIKNKDYYQDGKGSYLKS